MAALVWVMIWHAHRTMSADAERAAVSEENARLLETQRRFLQDASHQLRTPITIALGHAELLARDLADRQGQRDIHVVVGELTRLKSLAERLLLIAASENPDFLRLEPVALDCFVMEVLRRWRPTADRLWRLGRLDAITVIADRERLGLAIDALLENAIQHTGPDDVIRLSVRLIDQAAHLIIEDSGAGIPRGELARIFDRFTTSRGASGQRGTGLGLPLVRAIARGHGGEVRVRSSPGEGSKFEFMLPVTAPSADGLVHLPMPAQRRRSARDQAAVMDGEQAASQATATPAGEASASAALPRARLPRARLPRATASASQASASQAPRASLPRARRPRGRRRPRGAGPGGSA